MNTSAIFMMAISMILLWGGLILAMLHLAKHPDAEEDEVLDEVKDQHIL
ncbi:methionine/alanine import family NSS transporter small subunit [Acinetobacter bohemicus]|uniref:Methionine/alanine import family NSS transporter small subunit n=1 Tax=Acinetobacter lwoffii TaxID=28090 RepID=A0A9D2ZZC5_ACILW|nr:MULTISPECIES: methionine/alanine import family NSS transporter small subunit [unclassified Acinetobacter]HJF28144.1 methionine/alanine import family NSS transporter small subunit [Acinetobacter lwoffii]MCO8045203.1 methionine/alanine import family NSS transporter small subunit [Acinetobacter sp. S4397-1]TQR61724.1 methionine/alanine import family NSS transporter small subunit [Acinetobacter sp. RF14B]TSH75803.1 methionine/alanine import family NSS transporter small subunit [Acinetobacter sp.